MSKNIAYQYSNCIAVDDKLCKKIFAQLFSNEKIKLRDIVIFRKVGSENHFVTFANWSSLLRYILFSQIAFVYQRNHKEVDFSQLSLITWNNHIANGDISVLCDNMESACVGAENNLLYSRLEDLLKEKNLISAFRS